MVLNKRKSIIATLFFVLSFNVFALAVPKLEGRVNDYAGIISKNTEAKITEYLAALENSTGIQMAVLTVQSLEGLLLSLLFREVQNSLSFKFVWPTQPRTLLDAPCVRRYVHSSRKWCKLWRFFLLLLFFLF